MKKFTFGALLLLLWASPSLAVFCDLLPTCTGSSPCDFNNQASWVACGGAGMFIIMSMGGRPRIWLRIIFWYLTLSPSTLFRKV